MRSKSHRKWEAKKIGSAIVAVVATSLIMAVIPCATAHAPTVSGCTTCDVPDTGSETSPTTVTAGCEYEKAGHC